MRTWELGNGFGITGGAGIELGAPFEDGFGSAYCRSSVLCAGFGLAAADQEGCGGQG